MHTRIGIVLFLFFLVACGGKKTVNEQKEAAIVEEVVELNAVQQKNAGIVIASPIRQSINTELKVNGIVEVPPQNIVSISFPMGGYLRSTRLLPGMQVSKGEVIAVMEDQSLVQLQQDYLMARQRLELLEADYNRQSALRKEDVNAAKVYQQALADFNSQKILCKGYTEKLQLIGIDPAALTTASISRTVPLRAPISGFVSKVNINIGKYVTGTDVLFELINPDNVYAALTVFEKDISKVVTGQSVRLSFVNDPFTIYAGKVWVITRNVDENRSALVHCDFDKQPRKLLPGMFLQASILIENRDALTVPEGAVVRFENRFFVFEQMAPEKFALREVKTGNTDKGVVELLVFPPGLEQKKIVTQNAYLLLSKLKNSSEE
jgi:cobalt-zinc-cadmium efflux system membrane fusion protein